MGVVALNSLKRCQSGKMHDKVRKKSFEANRCGTKSGLKKLYTRYIQVHVFRIGFTQELVDKALVGRCCR